MGLFVLFFYLFVPFLYIYIIFRNRVLPGVVVDACKLPAFGKLRQEDQLHSELEVSLGYKRPCLRKPKEKRKKSVCRIY